MIFMLAKKGYGTVNELNEWDTPQLLDAIEFEHIQNDIQRHFTESN